MIAAVKSIGCVGTSFDRAKDFRVQLSWQSVALGRVTPCAAIAYVRRAEDRPPYRCSRMIRLTGASGHGTLRDFFPT